MSCDMTLWAVCGNRRQASSSVSANKISSTGDSVFLLSNKGFRVMGVQPDDGPAFSLARCRNFWLVTAWVALIIHALVVATFTVHGVLVKSLLNFPNRGSYSSRIDVFRTNPRPCRACRLFSSSAKRRRGRKGVPEENFTQAGLGHSRSCWQLSSLPTHPFA
jgi:hypothetical protein